MGKVFDHPYRVVRYDPAGDVIAEVAQCVHFDLARACQLQASRIWPKDEVTVQHGIRIMKRRRGETDT